MPLIPILPSMTNSPKGYLNNPGLATPKSPRGWKGTPIDANGRFQNLHHPFIPKFADVLRWKLLQKNPYKNLKKTELWNPEIHTDEGWLKENNDVIVWLGHCTFYIRINGIQLLTDPVFGDVFSLKRKSRFPIDPLKLNQLDYVLISHDHRDHLDKSSLAILSQSNPEVRYLTGLGMKKVIYNFTHSSKIEEAGWYQKYTTPDTIEISFIPQRHWSKRGLNDTNKRLWGGFIIASGGKHIFFGGDSAYDLHYQELGEVFGRFDYAILGIGAYEPRWFMESNHQNPEEAIKGFKELHAGYFIPMHYGTFDLSDEPLNKPLNDLGIAAETGNVKEKLKILEPGQAFVI